MANAQTEAAPPSRPAQGNIRLNADAIAMLVSRAKDFLKSGDFASARLLLRRAAEAGSPNAALMLGETFDPLVMHELGAIGIKADSAQARRWYEKAAELGSDIAAQRLAKLAQTGQ
jgi:TPR repeat protein